MREFILGVIVTVATIVGYNLLKDAAKQQALEDKYKDYPVDYSR